jgi:tripartite-type tricarboxylate transporter receptor subunit TctC
MWSTAFANTWPTKEITLIVPFPPGGTTDKIARAFANDLPTILKVPVVVKNVPGANNIRGMQEVLAGDPDYTFIVTASSIITSHIPINSDLYKKFQPIMIVGSSHQILYRNPNTDPNKLLAQIKAKERIQVAVPDVAGEQTIWIDGLKGMSVDVVPFKGTAQQAMGVMQGQPEYGVLSVFGGWQWFSQKQLIPVMIGANERSKFFPNVPTTKELGLTGNAFDIVYLLASSKEVNPKVAQQLNSALKFVALNSDAIKNYDDTGMNVNLYDLKKSKEVWDDQERKTKAYYKMK